MRQAMIAGSTFGGGVGLGLLAGFWLAGRTGQNLWVVVGMFAGLALGGVLALRLLLAASK